MKTNVNWKYCLTSFALALFLGGNSFPAAAADQNGGAAAGSGTSQSATSGAASGDNENEIKMMIVAGKVIQTMDSGGYTFALVEKGEARAWVALPKAHLAVGDEIECPPGMVMSNFFSKSLNYTFTQIVFASGVKVTSHVGGSGEEAKKEEAPPPKRPEKWKNF